MKSKILYIGEFQRKNNLGGAPMTNTILVKHLESTGKFEVQALSPIFKNESPIDHGLPVAYLKTKYFRGKSFGDLLCKYSFAQQVKKYLKRSSFSPGAVYIDAHTYLSKLFPDTPIVFSIHGSLGGKVPLKRWLSNPYTALCDTIDKHEEYKTLIKENVVRIITNSKKSYELLLRDYALAPSIAAKVIIAERGCDIKRFGVESLTKEECRQEIKTMIGIKDEELGPFLLFVGGVSAHKDQHELIESLAIITRRHPNTVLLLAGKDVGDMARCREAIKKNNLQKRAFLLGTVSDHELGLLFKGSDIYVSAATEGFGINQAEGMMMNLPLIAWDKGAIKDLFTDNVHGFLIHGREQFIEKILLLIENPKLRNEMGERAKEHSTKNFGPEKHNKIVEAAFEQAILEKA